MRFKPCIDLHNGRVKQIVGGTLSDDPAGQPITNFETDRSPAWFAGKYRQDELTGGHVIMLGPGNTDAALLALAAFPGGMQIGGGIGPHNARMFLDAGASHVIVTSFLFDAGEILWDRLTGLVGIIGRERLVIDLSCRPKNDRYFVVTNRWQTWTNEIIAPALLERLAGFCDEFLVHAVDVEGKMAGIDETLVSLLAASSPIPVTYAGGVVTLADLDTIAACGHERIDATVGSALDLFGGPLNYQDVVAWHKEHAPKR
jgi:phosphoribosylformimino-5-aminoimidazole carboxamide ribotide isomerase